METQKEYRKPHPKQKSPLKPTIIIIILLLNYKFICKSWVSSKIDFFLHKYFKTHLARDQPTLNHSNIRLSWWHLGLDKGCLFAHDRFKTATRLTFEIISIDALLTISFKQITESKLLEINGTFFSWSIVQIINSSSTLVIWGWLIILVSVVETLASRCNNSNTRWPKFNRNMITFGI